MTREHDRDNLAALIAANRTESSDDLAQWLFDQGVRAPARVITDPAELETLPGRTIVVGKSNVGYQLTSWDGFTKAANWASPYDYGNRATSHEVIEKEGSVSVVFDPTEEEEVRRNV